MADMIDTSTEAVKALLHGVTAGPWTFEREAEPEDEHPRHFVCHPLTECDATTVCNLEPSRAETEAQREANARFIAAARELVPALLAERDALRAQLDAAVEALAEIASGRFSGQLLMSLPPKDPAAEYARATLAQIKGADK